MVIQVCSVNCSALLCVSHSSMLDLLSMDAKGGELEKKIIKDFNPESILHGESNLLSQFFDLHEVSFPQKQVDYHHFSVPSLTLQ